MGNLWLNLETIFHGLRTKLFSGATDVNILYQLVIVVVVLLAIFLVSGWIRRMVNRVLANVMPGDKHHLPQIRAKLVDAAVPLVGAVILGIMSMVAKEAHWGHQIIYAAVDLLVAWVIIRLVTGMFVSPAWRSTAA